MAIESGPFQGTKLTGEDATSFVRQTGISVESMTGQRDAAAKMVSRSLETYGTREERAALRCALGDAAHLCDAVARDIENGYRSRGRVSKQGQHLALAAKTCGDAIWQMREKIKFDD